MPAITGARGPQQSLLDPNHLESTPHGVKLERKYPAFKISEDLKYAVRDQTVGKVSSLSKVIGAFNCRLDLISMKSRTVDMQGSDTILPKLGALTVKDIGFDYGASWKSGRFEYLNKMGAVKPHNEKCALTYIASPNIGESKRSPDAPIYRNLFGTLNKSKFLLDFKDTCKMGVRGQIINGADHLVWNPVGMGAFLRNVKRNYFRLPERAIDQLRIDMAKALLEAFAEEKSTSSKLHLCLYAGKGETNRNYNAFIKALEEMSSIRPSVVIHRQGDMLEIGQALANKYGSNKANVIVAANRKLLGNHYFDRRALRASDENLHRRSTDLALAAFHLNDGFSVRGRRSNELANRVIQLGGTANRESFSYLSRFTSAIAKAFNQLHNQFFKFFWMASSILS
ncbi:MAG: hypothetical protein S4CHLAM37_12210 [Chlamydiia bacterium]|nr:hypothetical protein [Chlamydiia bacterium]